MAEFGVGGVGGVATSGAGLRGVKDAGGGVALAGIGMSGGGKLKASGLVSVTGESDCIAAAAAVRCLGGSDGGVGP